MSSSEFSSIVAGESFQSAEWEATGLAIRFRYLRPDSAVAAKVLELQWETLDAAAEFNEVRENTRNNDTYDTLEEEVSALSESIAMLKRSEERLVTLGIVHTSIWTTLRPPETNMIQEDLDYGKVVDNACEARIREINKINWKPEIARIDLLNLVDEARSLYHQEPDCLSFDDPHKEAGVDRDLAGS